MYIYYTKVCCALCLRYSNAYAICCLRYTSNNTQKRKSKHCPVPHWCELFSLPIYTHIGYTYNEYLYVYIYMLISICWCAFTRPSHDQSRRSAPGARNWDRRLQWEVHKMFVFVFVSRSRSRSSSSSSFKFNNSVCMSNKGRLLIKHWTGPHTTTQRHTHPRHRRRWCVYDLWVCQRIMVEWEGWVGGAG